MSERTPVSALHCIALWRIYLDMVRNEKPLSSKINVSFAWPADTHSGAQRLSSMCPPTVLRSHGAPSPQGHGRAATCCQAKANFEPSPHPSPAALVQCSSALVSGGESSGVMSTLFGWDIMGECGCHIQLVMHTTPNMSSRQSRAVLRCKFGHASVVAAMEAVKSSLGQ